MVSCTMFIIINIGTSGIVIIIVVTVVIAVLLIAGILITAILIGILRRGRKRHTLPTPAAIYDDSNYAYSALDKTNIAGDTEVPLQKLPEKGNVTPTKENEAYGGVLTNQQPQSSGDHTEEKC